MDDKNFVWVPTTYLDVEEAEEAWMPFGENEDDWMACGIVNEVKRCFYVDSVICCYLLLKRKKNKTIEEEESLEKIKNHYEEYYAPEWPNYLKLIEGAKKQYRFTKRQENFCKEYSVGLVNQINELMKII